MNIEVVKDTRFGAQESSDKLVMGDYCSYIMRRTPRRMLHCLSYYKFAARMLQRGRGVVDIGCNEGTGTYLLEKEVGDAYGVDFDEGAIASARRNFPEMSDRFIAEDIRHFSKNRLFGGATCFDVIEHIEQKNENEFLGSITSLLDANGTLVIGTPSKISQEFASAVSKKGHINIYDHVRLKRVLKQFFHHVFLFSANDELVHTGFHDLAHYFLCVCSIKK